MRGCVEGAVVEGAVVEVGGGGGAEGSENNTRSKLTNKSEYMQIPGGHVGQGFFQAYILYMYMYITRVKE